jgi:hypothetical protein
MQIRVEIYSCNSSPYNIEFKFIQKNIEFKLVFFNFNFDSMSFFNLQ